MDVYFCNFVGMSRTPIKTYSNFLSVQVIWWPSLFSLLTQTSARD